MAGVAADSAVTNASGNEEVDVKGKGFGDINFGASYRLMRETVNRPDIVLNARVKPPTGRHPWGVELVEVPGTLENLKVPERLSTGSGVWGASAGVSVLKTIDPMVVFGSFTYFYNFKRHFADLDEANFDQPGSVKIGNAFQFEADTLQNLDYGHLAGCERRQFDQFPHVRRTPLTRYSPIVQGVLEQDPAWFRLQQA